jgi:hypothetical protein
MRHIQKKLYLDEFKSRMPSVIESYFVNEFEVSGSNVANEFSASCATYKTSYGLVPKSICDWTYGKYANKLISYHTFVSWYHFLKFYIRLLQPSDCDFTFTYANAVEYYEKHDDGKYSDDECLDFDEKVDIISNGVGGETLLEQAQKCVSIMDSTYFPMFEIPTEFQEYWNCKKLAITDVKKWIGWFEGNGEFSGKTLETCKDSDNCCLCSEYVQRGGTTILAKMKEFLNGIKYVGGCDAYAEIKVLLTNRIDDLGEESVFAEEWEGGIDYSVTNYENSHITSHSPIISYNDNDYMLKSGKGFSFDSTFKEYTFSDSGYTRYIDVLFNKDNQSFYPQTDNGTEVLTYAANSEGKIVFNPTNDKMAEKYDIITNGNNGFLYADGTCYEVEVHDIIKVNNAPYIVYEDESSNYYAFVNGNKYYSSLSNKGTDVIKIGSTSYNILPSKSVCNVKGKIVMADGLIVKSYAEVGNEIILLSGDTIVQENNGTLIANDTILGKKLESDSSTIISECYKVKDNILYSYYPFTIYNAKRVSGYTESKLSSFLSTVDEAYDDMGNKLNGLYKLQSDGTIEEPKANGWLEMFYKPDLAVRLSEEEEGDNYATYWCDYLSDMTVYYLDSNGNKHCEKHLPTSGALDTISECKEEFLKESSDETFANTYGTVVGLMCDITYHMGCVVRRDFTVSNDKYTYSTYNRNGIDGFGYSIVNSGVTYVDTVQLTEAQCPYYTNDTDFFMLNYYEMTWDENYYYNEDYNYASSVNKSWFSYDIYDIGSDLSESDGSKRAYNGFVAFPTIREEYRLGSSSKENIDQDIYISRGTARSFDSHLKLLEVNSMEALEQYGNGYFNIIEN